MKKYALVLLLLLAVNQSAVSQLPDGLSATERGLWVAEEANRRDEGFGDTSTEILMRLISADGRVRERRLTWQTLEAQSQSEGDKSLTVFHEPRDIAGTAFLSYTHLNEPDDQWLYLPSLKRVKRIASANKSGSFMGSEFSYEDLLSDQVGRFEHVWLMNEPCGALECFVIERRPLDEDSGYSKQVVWIDTEEYRSWRIDFYDRKDRYEKTLVFDQYQLYLGRFWRAGELRMTSHLTGKSTELSFADYRFQSGLTEQDFDPDALRRLR